MILVGKFEEWEVAINTGAWDAYVKGIVKIFLEAGEAFFQRFLG